MTLTRASNSTQIYKNAAEGYYPANTSDTTGLPALPSGYTNASSSQMLANYAAYNTSGQLVCGGIEKNSYERIDGLNSDFDAYINNSYMWFRGCLPSQSFATYLTNLGGLAQNPIYIFQSPATKCIFPVRGTFRSITDSGNGIDSYTGYSGSGFHLLYQNIPSTICLCVGYGGTNSVTLSNGSIGMNFYSPSDPESNTYFCYPVSIWGTQAGSYYCTTIAFFQYGSWRCCTYSYMNNGVQVGTIRITSCHDTHGTGCSMTVLSP